MTQTVTLIAEDPTENTLTFYGKTAYKYGITALNSVGDIFGHGNGDFSGRSINDRDITLKSNIRVTSKDSNNVWQLNVE